MDESRDTTPLDPESRPEPVSYLRFLERWNAAAGPPAARQSGAGPADARPADAGPERAGDAAATAPGAEKKAAARAHGRRPRRRAREATAGDSLGPFLAPRRRTATETIKVRLAPEQLYWLRLTAARAGRKVSESTIVAAGLRLVERLDLDWRCIDSRTALAAALAESFMTGRAAPAGLGVEESEWEAIQRQAMRSRSRLVADPPAGAGGAAQRTAADTTASQSAAETAGPPAPAPGPGAETDPHEP
jgi:hypothetical protein